MSGESDVDFGGRALTLQLQRQLEERKDRLSIKEAELLRLREQVQELKQSEENLKKENANLRLTIPKRLPKATSVVTISEQRERIGLTPPPPVTTHVSTDE